MNALLLSLPFGFFVAILVWGLYAIFKTVPVEDRQFRDRPALGFRLVWPFIQAVDFHFSHWMNQVRVEASLVKLKRAGVEYSLSPQQFIAAKIVSAGLFCIATGVAASLISHSFVWLGVVGGIAGFWYPELWLREISACRSKSILRHLPFYLDVITLAVEAGSNLTGGITQAVQKTSDSPLRKEFSRVLRDIRSGKARAEALRDLSDRTGSPSVSSVVASLIQAEKTGASLGPILRAQANQLRTQRFQAAEKKAMEAPVKMLGPLVIFIFPTTSLVIGFILLSKAVQEGLITWKPLLWAYGWPG
ncbi:MAG: tight adherence protein C [Porticoccaceae bacterium]|jgi:tight adherence protein C